MGRGIALRKGIGNNLKKNLRQAKEVLDPAPAPPEKKTSWTGMGNCAPLNPPMT